MKQIGDLTSAPGEEEQIKGTNVSKLIFRVLA